MVLLIVVSLLLYALICSPPYIAAKQRTALYRTDVAAPLLVLLLWLLMTMAGMGQQSPSHIIEIPITLFITAMFFYLRVFVLDKLNKRSQANSIAFLGASLIAAILLKFLLPFIPE